MAGCWAHRSLPAAATLPHQRRRPREPSPVASCPPEVWALIARTHCDITSRVKMYGTCSELHRFGSEDPYLTAALLVLQPVLAGRSGTSLSLLDNNKLTRKSLDALSRDHITIACDSCSRLFPLTATDQFACERAAVWCVAVQCPHCKGVMIPCPAQQETGQCQYSDACTSSHAQVSIDAAASRCVTLLRALYSSCKVCPLALWCTPRAIARALQQLALPADERVWPCAVERLEIGSKHADGSASIHSKASTCVNEWVYVLSTALQGSNGALNLRLPSSVSTLILRPTSRDPYSPAQLDSLCRGVAANRTLRHVEMIGCGMDDSTTASLASALLHNCTIQRLSLAHNHIGGTDGSRTVMAALGQNTGIRVLDLSHNSIDNEDATVLGSSIERNTHLEEMDLSCNQIVQDGSRIKGSGVTALCKACDARYYKRCKVTKIDLRFQYWVSDSEGLIQVKPEKAAMQMLECKTVLAVTFGYNSSKNAVQSKSAQQHLRTSPSKGKRK